MQRNVYIAIVLGLVSFTASAQVVPENISYVEIYEFLDELAAERLIEINSVVKPYSKVFIADRLVEAAAHKDQLSSRQQEELEFYLRAYRIEMGDNVRQPGDIDLYRPNGEFDISLDRMGIYFHDSSFAASIRPVIGMQSFSNANESFYHRYWGLEAWAYIDKSVGFYASIRDNNESVKLTDQDYLNRRPGTPAKRSSSGSIDYSESRGGLTVSWDWGHVGLIKEQFAWGSGYSGSNIFSDKIPSPAQISLHLKPADWFTFDYVHAWLTSEVVDSARSYVDASGKRRDVYRDKYVAANMFTIIPVRGLHLSLGNSIVYSDIGVHAAYLVPFLFFKSVDHTLNGVTNTAGQNSQVFADISSRNIKHLHLYASLFFDELSFTRFTDDSEHNIWSAKGGAQLSNFPLKDVALTAEYTMTRPITYQHNFASTTFESNHYIMGHYLKDNAQELFLRLTVKPLRGLRVAAEYTLARKGPRYTYVQGSDAVKYPFMESVEWESSMIGLRASYELTPNGVLFAAVALGDISGEEMDLYTPEVLHGQTTTISAGFRLGR